MDVQFPVYIKNVKQTHAYVANKNTIQITGYAKLWNKQKYTGKPMIIPVILIMNVRAVCPMPLVTLVRLIFK